MFFKKKEEITAIEAKNYDKICTKKFGETYFPLTDIEFECVITKNLIHKNEKLELENLDLKNEISYYERYIKFLEDNYIFVLKSSSAKEIFDKIGEQNEKLG